MNIEPVTLITQCEMADTSKPDVTIKQEPHEDVPISRHSHSSVADSSAPSCSEIQSSRFQGVENEVLAHDGLPSRSRINIHSGKTTTELDAMQTSDNWEIYKDGEHIGHIVDDSSPHQSNWGTNVNSDSVSAIVQPVESLLNYVRQAEPNTEKPFVCLLCGFRFKWKNDLKRHARTHTGEKPFKCTMCEYRCAQSQQLTRHMRTHTGDKPYRCTVCDYRCAQSTHLTVHMKIHTGEKLFKCPICGYRCAEHSYLNRHMRTHTGERPFKCSVCEYRSATHSDLKRHMLIHTGEKPFVCPVCEYRCSQKCNLKQHILTHD